MTDRERELLISLIEECAEVQTAACKALRFGIDAHHPEGSDTIRAGIASGLGGLLYVLDLLVEARAIDPDAIDAGMRRKRATPGESSGQSPG